MNIAKGPNALNLNAYTQGEEEYDDEANQTNEQGRGLQHSKSIQDQFDNFIKEINKYDEVLKNVATDLNEMQISQQFLHDFYPEFIVNTSYQTDQQKKIILSSDPQMGKVITNLQRTNKQLKDQIKGWSIEFAKTTKLSQTLLSQNQILRKAICTKNKQLLKLISSISNTENHEITDMKENLQILREENGVLLDHLEKMKYYLKEKREDQQRLRNAYNEKRTETIFVEKQNNEIEDRQEHLSKSVALIEDSLEELIKRKKKLQKEKSRLLTLKQDYTKDQSSIEFKFKQSQQNNNTIQRQLKGKFEEKQLSKHQLIEGIDQQTDKIQKIKEDTRKIQVQIQRKEHRLQEYNKINKDLKTKHDHNAEIIQKLQKQHTKFVQEQGTLQAEIYILEEEVGGMTDQLKEFDKVQKQMQQNHKQSLKSMEEANHKQLVEQKSRLLKQSKEVLKKIFEEKLELSLKEKEVRDWQLKVELKKEQMNELKAQMKEVRVNQTKHTQLKSKLTDQSVAY